MQKTEKLLIFQCFPTNHVAEGFGTTIALQNFPVEVVTGTTLS